MVWQKAVNPGTISDSMPFQFKPDTPVPTRGRETAPVENDEQTKTFDYGLKHDLALIWWAERCIEVPAGHHFFVTKNSGLEGQEEESRELGKPTYVMVVKCVLSWPLRPLVNRFIVAPKGRLHQAVRRHILKWEQRERERGHTLFVSPQLNRNIRITN